MSQPTFQPRFLLDPRYWPVWLWLGLLRLLVLLPFRWQLAVGKGLGWVLQRIAPRRADVARRNIRHCFPALGDAEVEALTERHFDSLGISLLETAICWWASPQRLYPLIKELKGLEHIEQARREGRGVILLGAHFTTMEVCLRLLSLHFTFAPVYRRMNNPLLEYFTSRGRNKNTAGAIAKQDMVRSVRHLRQGGILWFAPDQQHQGRHSALVDFFGQPAHSATATASLAKIGKAAVIPAWFARERDGYRIELQAPLECFPSGDEVADTERYHRLIERHILQVPEQYLWVHKRFKDAPGIRY